MDRFNSAQASGLFSLTLRTRITGDYGRLVTVVRRYTPLVTCGDKFKGGGEWVRSPCTDTLSRIPVGVTSLVFGREGVTGVTWEVPWSYQARTWLPC